MGSGCLTIGGRSSFGFCSTTENMVTTDILGEWGGGVNLQNPIVLNLGRRNVLSGIL